MTRLICVLLTLLFSLSGPAMGVNGNFGRYAVAPEAAEMLYRGVPDNGTEKAILGQQGVAMPRGTAVDPDSLRRHVLGEDVNAGVVSFTTDREVARRFSGHNGTVIEVPRSSVQDRIVQRPSVGNYSHESEILIQGVVQGTPTSP